MTKHEDMAALRARTDVHFNCAQSVIVPFAAELGLTRQQAYDLTLNFGGGMGEGLTCGALVGALAVMGGLGLPQARRLELIDQFRDAHGAVDCTPLVESILARGEMKKAGCDKIVAWCVDWLCRETGIE